MEPEYIVELETDHDLNNALVVEAFPSIGVVSSIAASFIVKTLDLQYIGCIRYPGVTPSAVIVDGVPYPPVRIYYKPQSCGPEGKCKKLVVLMSEFPIPTEQISSVAGSILNWCREEGCDIIVSLEGLPSTDIDPEKETRVFGVGATGKMNDLMEKLGVETVKNGVVMGVSGVLLVEGRRLDQDVVCLLADADPRFPDSRGAVKLIEVIDKMLPKLKIETEPLKKDAEDLETKIKESIQQSRSGRDGIREIPAQMYG
ncbi:MAG: proteasome assembly chaperone family protein [Thermoplasmatota archaeon]